MTNKSQANQHQPNAHNFWKSLAIENDKSWLADAFYFNVFGVENIIRFNTGSKRDMEFQRADIDVQLQAWNRHANVSEKFRDVDYNDLYIELFSMFPNVKGWMSSSKATHLAYFFPNRMIWLDKTQLINAFEHFISPGISKQEINQLVENYPQKNASVRSTLILKEHAYSVRYIKAYNKTKTKSWDTIGVSIPFNAIENLGVKLQEFRL